MAGGSAGFTGVSQVVRLNSQASNDTMPCVACRKTPGYRLGASGLFYVWRFGSEGGFYVWEVMNVSPPAD